MMSITRRTSHQPALNTMKKPLTILSVLVIAALTMGMAVAQHMEQRAQQDRLSFGDTAQ
jgi:hypothetical protein